MAHDHHGRSAKTAEAPNDGLIVGELAVAAQLDELVDESGQVVDEVRALGMAGDFGLLPGVQALIGVQANLGQLGVQRLDLRAYLARARRLQQFGQFIDLGFQIGDGLLEIEIMALGRQDCAFGVDSHCKASPTRGAM